MPTPGSDRVRFPECDRRLFVAAFPVGHESAKSSEADLGKITHPVGLISGNNREPSMVLRHERQSVRRCEIAVALKSRHLLIWHARQAHKLAQPSGFLIHDGARCGNNQKLQ